MFVAQPRKIERIPIGSLFGPAEWKSQIMKLINLLHSMKRRFPSSATGCVAPNHRLHPTRKSGAVFVVDSGIAIAAFAVG